VSYRPRSTFDQPVAQSVDAGLSNYGMVNATLFVAVARYTWLHRAEPDEDE